MRRRRVPRRAWFAGGLVLGLALILGFTFAPDLGGNSARAVPPAALSRIALKNDRAAIESAARMRANSAAHADAVDSMRAAEERGAAAANESLERFSQDEAGRGDIGPERH